MGSPAYAEQANEILTGQGNIAVKAFLFYGLFVTPGARGPVNGGLLSKNRCCYQAIHGKLSNRAYYCIGSVSNDFLGAKLYKVAIRGPILRVQLLDLGIENHVLEFFEMILCPSWSCLALTFGESLTFSIMESVVSNDVHDANSMVQVYVLIEIFLLFSVELLGNMTSTVWDRSFLQQNQNDSRYWSRRSSHFMQHLRFNILSTHERV